jgi:DNA-binding MarR family transcriptional regulator
MTKRQRRILEVLAAADDGVYGLDIVAAGATKRALVYVELARMEDRGWITSQEISSDTGFPRRQYRITEAGGAMLLPAARSLRG